MHLIIDFGIFRHWYDTLIYVKGACWLRVSPGFGFGVYMLNILYHNNLCCFCKKNGTEEEEEKRLIKEQMTFDEVYESSSSAPLRRPYIRLSSSITRVTDVIRSLSRKSGFAFRKDRITASLFPFLLPNLERIRMRKRSCSLRS